MQFASVTRRAVVRAGGRFAVTTLIAARFGRGRPRAAQVASPVASPTAGDGLVGRYVVVRSRMLTGTRPVAEVLETIRAGYVPLLGAIPGFIAYLGIANPASRQAAFVTVFEDKAGTDASTRQAGTWLQENGYDFFQGDPIVLEGLIGVAAGSVMGRSTTATPLAGTGLEGDYVVIRSRTLKAGRSGAELLEMVQEGFVPLVEAVPGFVAYLAVANEGTRDQFSIGIYADEAGADASTQRAADWVTQGAADFAEADLVVIEGPIGLAVVSGAV